MHQQRDPIFAQLLRRACKGTLTQANVSILNKKLVTSLILSNLLNNIVIVQRTQQDKIANQLPPH